MKNRKWSFKRSNWVGLCLGLMLMPFLVGFGYPDSTGTYVGASAGGGRYRFSPGCSRYTYGVDFQETEVSLQHRMATKPVEPSASILERIKPGHITLGANGDFINKSIKVIAWDSVSTDPDKPGPVIPAEGQPQVGSTHDANGYAGGARIALDWKWIGTVAGVSALTYDRGEDKGGNKYGRVPNVLPILGLRLGDENQAYVSAEMLGSSPIASGGGILNVGLGGKLGDTHLWAGYGAAPYEKDNAVLKASRPFGPLEIAMAMQANRKDFFRFREYGASLGFYFRLPGN